MGCGRSENHPVTISGSRHSTVGGLRRVSSDLLIHRGNGCRAINLKQLSWVGVVPRIGLLLAEASLGA